MRAGFWWTNIGNFLNKILGFIRTALRLLIVGDSAISDIFLLADKSVSLFRRVFVDGNFQSIFINHYAQQAQGHKEKSFITNVFILMMKNLIIITVVFCAISPFLVKLFRQISSNETLLLKFLLYLSPLIILIFLMSFFTSILNINNKFQISGLAPNVGNIAYVIIFYLAAKNYVNWSIGTVLIFGALSYALLQVIFMGIFSYKYFGKPSAKIESNEFSKDILKGFGVNLIVPFSEVFVGIIATKYHSGIFSYLDYGHKYICTIFSIIAVPISTAIIPSLSKKNAEKNIESFRTEASNSFILTHILCLPFVFLLYFLTDDILGFCINKISAIENKVDLCINIKIISISLYFMMQNRILNTISTASNQLKITLYGLVVYGVITIIASIILPMFSSYGFAWAGNFAFLGQFLYLFISNIRTKSMKFDTKQSLSLVFSAIVSLGISLLIMSIINISKTMNLNQIVFCKINFTAIGIYFMPFVILYITYLFIYKKYVKALFVK